MEIVSMLLAFVAGLFSILSPCVLPLVPIVLGAAVAEHKLGPVALAVGLALSFTAIGMFIATIGYTIGLDGDVFRSVAAVLLVFVGAGLVGFLERSGARALVQHWVQLPFSLHKARNLVTSPRRCLASEWGAHYRC